MVGHRDGRHCLDRDHQVVFEGDQILYVGPAFEGHVDTTLDASGKLVCPGFVDTHVHSGHRGPHRLISDGGRADAFGQPFLEVSAPRAGARIDGDPRFMVDGDPDLADALELNASYTVAEMLRNGTTTFVEFGAGARTQDALAVQCRRLGIRGYLGTRVLRRALGRRRSGAARTARWTRRRASGAWTRRWPASPA